MKVLLLSAYDAASHVHWRKLLMAQCPSIDWTVLSLPPRYFSWRIRGNSLTWSQQYRDVLEQSYDLVIATSMVDLATLRGLVPTLSHVPSILYFHENQFAYPLSSDANKSADALMVQLYSALAAQVICFNTEYNRQSFFDGLAVFLKKLPDHVPKDIIDCLTEKSRVLAVPIMTPMIRNKSPHNRTKRSCVWNHRWEYDKGPERLLAFVEALPHSIDMTLHVVGQAFRHAPREFTEVRKLLEDRGQLGQWGYIESEDEYFSLLASTEYVLSTAEHDFQGLAVIEAVARGCIPLLPGRLAYPELFAEEYLYAPSNDKSKEAHSMVAKLMRWLEEPPEAPDVSCLYEDVLVPLYSALFTQTASPNV